MNREELDDFLSEVNNNDELKAEKQKIILSIFNAPSDIIEEIGPDPTTITWQQVMKLHGRAVELRSENNVTKAENEELHNIINPLREQIEFLTAKLDAAKEELESYQCHDREDSKSSAFGKEW